MFRRWQWSLPRPCTPCASYGRMGWMMLHCRRSAGRLLLLDWSMRQVRGKATDHQRINSLFTRAKRWGNCAPDSPTFEELCETADEQLFDKIKLNSNHVLKALLPLPSVASQNYNLRRRPQTLTLPTHNSLSDCNFITGILYKECY